LYQIVPKKTKPYHPFRPKRQERHIALAKKNFTFFELTTYRQLRMFSSGELSPVSKRKIRKYSEVPKNHWYFLRCYTQFNIVIILTLLHKCFNAPFYLPGKVGLSIGGVLPPVGGSLVTA
jgi:hypothetical protein